MKITNFKFLLIVLILSACSNHYTTLNSGKKIDHRLIGVWVGFEKDKQIEGFEKKWEMTRLDDGTFTLDFNFIQNGSSHQHIETGSWWIENGKFYEYHDDSKKTDIYEYKILDKNRIKFISKHISVDMNSDTYEFIDTRKKSINAK